MCRAFCELDAKTSMKMGLSNGIDWTHKTNMRIAFCDVQRSIWKFLFAVRFGGEVTCWNGMTLSWKWRSKRGIQNGDVWLKPREEKPFSRSRKILLMTCLKAYKKCSLLWHLENIQNHEDFRGLQMGSKNSKRLNWREMQIHHPLYSKPKSALSVHMFQFKRFSSNLTSE